MVSYEKDKFIEMQKIKNNLKTKNEYEQEMGINNAHRVI